MEDEKKDIKPIDFEKIFKTLWPHRKKYYRVLPAVLILTYLFTLFFPRYYKCTVSLAPESNSSSLSGSLGSLASSFGLGDLAGGKSDDAIFAEIYPDVIKSKNFIAELLTVDVKTADGETACNYYTYLRDKQKAPWWSVLKSWVQEAVKPSPKDTCSGNEVLSVFNLTELQNDIFGSVQGKITCSVDKKTDVVAITVEDQDPLVCATMGDATCRKLQDFIIAYRTNKARIDYEYYKKICEESKAEYVLAAERYASFADSYSNSVLNVYKSKVDRLENEMQEKYTIYQAMNKQMQAARAKLQEAMPAFTVIESASVPVKPAGPKRMFISVGMMMLAFFVLSGWFLVRK